jgi:exosortase
LLGSGVVSLGPLSSTWNDNSNYSFGWWIPVVCLVLFSERWPLRPSRETAVAFPFFPLLIVWGLIFLAFRVIAESDPDWRPGLWVLTGLYMLVLVTWLWLEGGFRWVRHFAFPVGFLFLCVPWPFGIEYPLTQGLMRWNTILVSHSLRVIGISADPVGNIIQLQNCQLGVEEACSGILSLQASLVMGCLLGDIYRLNVRRRFLLVLSSMLLALVGNYLRTFFLALMAFYSGPDAVPVWHDTAGYAILVFTAIGSWLAALGFADETSSSTAARDVSVNDNPPERRSSLRLALVIFCAVLLAEAITQGWFVWRESKLVHHPVWSVQMPASIPSYKPVAISDVTLEALRCDKSLAGQWNDDQNWGWNVYWFQYEPKPYTRTVLSWHIPDRCLPSVGLVKDHDYPDFETSVNGIDLYVHPKRFVSKEQVVYLFWVVYPNQGDLPTSNYIASKSIFSKISGVLIDIWKGYRGVGVETLEVAILGPKDYDSAKAKYLTELKSVIQPVSSGKATSH